MAQAFAPGDMDELRQLQRKIDIWLLQGAELKQSCEQLRKRMESSPGAQPQAQTAPPPPSPQAPSVREWRNSMQVPIRVSRRGRPPRFQSPNEPPGRTRSAR